VRRPNDPAAYARRVLVNRHRSRLRRVLLEARYLRRSRDQQAYLPDFGEDAMVVWAAVGWLPARHRAVLALRFHEDLTEAEVARLLGLPLRTVKTLARRGLGRLRAELAAGAADGVKERR
jgi:RNA polymerase sigma factor (sigma-70 family)